MHLSKGWEYASMSSTVGAGHFPLSEGMSARPMVSHLFNPVSCVSHIFSPGKMGVLVTAATLQHCCGMG